jgi:putative sterol carrier protein
VSAFRLDPQTAVAIARRQLASAPIQLADGFARLVRRSPEKRLDQLMSTPARRVILDGIFWQMPQHVDRKQIAGPVTTVQWCITGRADGRSDDYRLTIGGGRCHVKRGAPEPTARVTITLTAVEFLRLAAGLSDPMQAYFSGRIKLAGDIMLAARLQSLFRIPTAGRAKPPRAAQQ